MNPYQILGISSDATDDEVKKAYRTLSKKYHPPPLSTRIISSEITYIFSQ